MWYLKQGYVAMKNITDKIIDVISGTVRPKKTVSQEMPQVYI